jgi:hypothetical protein
MTSLPLRQPAAIMLRTDFSEALQAEVHKTSSEDESRRGMRTEAAARKLGQFFTVVLSASEHWSLRPG